MSVLFDMGCKVTYVARDCSNKEIADSSSLDGALDALRFNGTPFMYDNYGIIYKNQYNADGSYKHLEAYVVVNGEIADKVERKAV